MSDFYWSPAYGFTVNKAPKILEAAFGDGYSQRSAQGINNNAGKWTLQFTNIANSLGDMIMAFLDAHDDGASFTWTPPNEENKPHNLLHYSGDLNDSIWVPSNLSAVTANQEDPFNSGKGYLLQENTATLITHSLAQTMDSLDLTPDNVNITLSSYLKSAGRTWATLQIRDKANNTKSAYIDLSTGNLGNLSSGSTASIQSVGNNWYRFSITANALTGSTLVKSWIHTSQVNGSRTYTGDGTSGILVYGPQMTLSSGKMTYVMTRSNLILPESEIRVTCNRYSRTQSDLNLCNISVDFQQVFGE